MKKVLILVGRPKNKKTLAFSGDKYQKAYEYLYSLAEKKGIRMFRSSYVWYDFDKKLFAKAWTYENNEWIKVKDIKPDLIYNKAASNPEAHHMRNEIAKDYKIINDPEFTLIANNKFLTSLLFPKYFKKYYKVKDTKGLLAVAKEIKGTKIVLKPAVGSGGKGVRIINKNSLSRTKIDDETIVQEFVDSSHGIRGIVEGVHDLRMVYVNNKLIYSYVRQPAQGSLLANLAQGGSMFIVERKRLPKKVLAIAKKVQDVFRFYDPKIYTIDIIFDKQQVPWIVELNTMPGIYFSPDQKKWQDRFYLKLIKIFSESAKSPKY